MGFGQAIGSCFRKYATFRGRAPRSEYWYFILFYVLLSIPANIIDSIIMPDKRTSGPVAGILALALLLPQLAVMVRRFHDSNRSGFWLLGYFVYTVVAVVGFVVLFGVTLAGRGPASMAGLYVAVLGLILLVYAIWLFVLTVIKGTDGMNAYGPDPLGPDVTVF